MVERMKQNQTKSENANAEFENSVKQVNGDLETLRLGTIVQQPITE